MCKVYKGVLSVSDVVCLCERCKGGQDTLNHTWKDRNSVQQYGLDSNITRVLFFACLPYFFCIFNKKNIQLSHQSTELESETRGVH